MIKGNVESCAGRLYMYYHGPIRAVLSDLSLQPRTPSEDVISTGHRIVFIPNEWTELNYSDIREKWETGTSQINQLEKSGYLDIYTDIEDVKRVKELLKDFHLPDNLRHGQYIKAFEDKDVIKKYLEEQESKKANEEFVMPEKKKYFDLDKGLSGIEKTQTKPDDVYTVNTDTSSLNRIVSLVEKQVEQSTKQAEQMTKMMETMQQRMLAMISNKKD